MNRKVLLWLSVAAALAVVVAYQTLGSSAARHSGGDAARADVPTVQPGADVLAGIVVVPQRDRRYDYRMPAFGPTFLVGCLAYVTAREWQTVRAFVQTWAARTFNRPQAEPEGGLPGL